MAIAAFLPLTEPTGPIRMVQENTLIQHGGWMFIAAAVGIAISGYWASQRSAGEWLLPTLLCVVTALLIWGWAVRRICARSIRVELDGKVDYSNSVVASWGIAIYVAGAGVGLALIGSQMLRRHPNEDASDELVAHREEEATKKCPECAETILEDAKVCRYCGHHFPTTKVRCVKCNHVQEVLADHTRFTCEQCNQALHRKHIVE